ncbi:MAG: hypothetical protein JXQ75_09195 [Phycisphaerae bacterium]|nr:hypothetical protein [Phycisphaerae bacterium]
MVDAELEKMYGPNWRTIEQYLKEIPTGFCFMNVGKPDPADGTVVRLHTWEEAKRVADYLYEGAALDNCRYLQFLLRCHQLMDEYRRLAGEKGLKDALANACTEAGHVLADYGKSENPDWWKCIYPNEKTTNVHWEISPEHHCCYIAMEMVIAHLTPHHLLRDMWYWYHAGHWPCGWEGVWPQGRLVVF